MLGWDKYPTVILSYHNEEKEHPTIYVEIAFLVQSPPKTRFPKILFYSNVTADKNL